MRRGTLRWGRGLIALLLLFTAYGVIGLPTTLPIGRDGRPMALAIGPRAWNSAPARALIQTLLAEPATPRDER